MWSSVGRSIPRSKPLIVRDPFDQSMAQTGPKSTGIGVGGCLLQQHIDRACWTNPPSCSSARFIFRAISLAHHPSIATSAARERGAPLLAIGAAAKAAGPLTANHTNALTHPICCLLSQPASHRPSLVPATLEPFSPIPSRASEGGAHATPTTQPHAQATGSGHWQERRAKEERDLPSLSQPPMSGAPAGGGGGAGRRPGRNYANVSRCCCCRRLPFPLAGCRPDPVPTHARMRTCRPPTTHIYRPPRQRCGTSRPRPPPPGRACASRATNSTRSSGTHRPTTTTTVRPCIPGLAARG